MHRTTVMLPESLKAKASRKALKDKISLGELIRNALERECANDRGSKDIAQNAFFTDQHFYKGKIPTNVAKDHDDYLY